MNAAASSIKTIEMYLLAQMEVTSQVIQQHIEMASKNSESKL